jgi:hypothetical protein
VGILCRDDAGSDTGRIARGGWDVGGGSGSDGSDGGTLWRGAHWRRRFLHDSADRADAEVQACASEQVGNSELAHGGAERLEISNSLANEVGETMDGLCELDERFGSVLVKTTEPGGDGGRGHEKGVGCGGVVPAASGLEAKDGESFGGRIVRPLGRRDEGQASPEDAKLFREEGGTCLEPLGFGGETDASDAAVCAPAADASDGVVGKCDGSEQTGFGVVRPGERQGDGGPGRSHGDRGWHGETVGKTVTRTLVRRQRRRAGIVPDKPKSAWKGERI